MSKNVNCKGQNMQIAKLTELFSYGIITDIRAVQDILNGRVGWRLEFTINDEVETTMYTTRGELKIYKTLEAVIADVNRIKGYYNDPNDQTIHLL